MAARLVDTLQQQPSTLRAQYTPLQPFAGCVLAHRTVSAIIHKAYPFGLILIKCPATIELCAYIAYTQRAPLSALIVITSRRQSGQGEGDGEGFCVCGAV